MYNKTQAIFEMSLKEGDDIAQEWRITASKEGVQISLIETMSHTLCRNEACELLAMLDSAITFAKHTQKAPEEVHRESGLGLFD